MAENKKGFVLYCDLIHTINKMPNDKAGELFKHILSYVNDKNPSTDDLVIELTFEPIKQQLKRDLVKYEGIRERNSANARKRWDATACERIPNDTKNADKVTVTDTVKVKDKVIKENKVSVAKMPLVDYQPCLDFWLKEFHPDWTFGGMQGKALKSLIKKIEKLRKNETDSIVELFKFICLKLPEWYKDKDLPIIDSKFNEIIEQIKIQKNGNTASKSSDTITTINRILANEGLL